MSDGDRSVLVPILGASDDSPERLPAYDDLTDAEESPAADFATDLVSLGFITAALRRSVRFWCATAVVGLLVGLGLSAAAVPTYQASTSLLLSPPSGQAPADSILTDAAVAQSRTVAGLAMHKLGLRQSVSLFLGTYTVTVVTDRVLLITVSAPSSNEAVSRASALATEFLRFRADQLEAGQKLLLSSLNQQINQAKQHIKAITARISQLSTQPASPAQQAKLNSLRTERSQAKSVLTPLEQTTNDNQAAIQAANTSTVKHSEVLDHAAPIPQSRHSRLKRLLLYGAIGLIVGLALGLAIVVVRALVSGRLRGRDDVAGALGAPVKLSVGTVRVRRWLPGRRGLAVGRGRNMRLIIAHLRNAVPRRRSRRAAALAVVAVDNAQVAALALVSLAVSCAEEGEQVVVADLSSGAHAAHLLGAKNPGIRTVSVNGTRLVVALPDRDDVVPVGPLHLTSPQAQPPPATKLAAACASADLLLTLVTLDPSLGGEHLATWATDAVVMVTAGQSSWTKLHAVGEMIRLAGTRLVSAVLVETDKTDESLGVTRAARGQRDAEIAEEGLHSDAGFVVAVDSAPGMGPSSDR
jgi:capsular polysaccharide biosynthesis protein